jgi:hypothetical protein
LRARNGCGMTFYSMPVRYWLAPLVVACNGLTLDAGTTYPGQLASAPATTRATMPATIDAITMDDTSLYFTCEDGWVYRLEKDGDAPPQRLASFPGGYAWGIALDDANVYWTALVDGVNGGLVLRVSKSGGEASTVAASQFRPWGIAVDEASVFWIEQGAPSDDRTQHLAPGSLKAIGKAGGSPRSLATDVASGDYLVVDADAVIWHENQAIRRVSKAGGPASALISATVPFAVSNLALANGRVLFAANSGTWNVESAPVAGGNADTLASDLPRPASIAPDGAMVFWNDSTGDTVGAIRSVPIAGGAPSLLWPPNAVGNHDNLGATALLVEPRAFYFVEYQALPSLTVSIRVLPR